MKKISLFISILTILAGCSSITDPENPDSASGKSSCVASIDSTSSEILSSINQCLDVYNNHRLSLKKIDYESYGYAIVQEKYWLSNGVVDSVVTKDGSLSESQNQKTDPVLREYSNLLKITQCSSTENHVCRFLKHASFDPETGLLTEYEFDWREWSIEADDQTRHQFKNPIWE